jgi:hypothetical protein
VARGPRALPQVSVEQQALDVRLETVVREALTALETPELHASAVRMSLVFIFGGFSDGCRDFASYLVAVHARGHALVDDGEAFGKKLEQHVAAQSAVGLRSRLLNERRPFPGAKPQQHARLVVKAIGRSAPALRVTFDNVGGARSQVSGFLVVVKAKLVRARVFAIRAIAVEGEEPARLERLERLEQRPRELRRHPLGARDRRQAAVVEEVHQTRRQQ